MVTDKKSQLRTLVSILLVVAIFSSFFVIAEIGIIENNEPVSVSIPEENNIEMSLPDEVINETNVTEEISLPIETNKTIEEPVVEEPHLISSILSLVAKANAYVGDLINIEATLTYDNYTPIVGQEINFYTDEFIGSEITNKLGTAEIDWDTSNLLPGTYPITVNFSPSELLEMNSVETNIILETEVVEEVVVNETITLNETIDTDYLTEIQNLTLKNSKRQNVKAKFKVLEKKSAGLGIAEIDKYDLEVIPENIAIKKLVLRNVDLTAETNLGLEELSKDFPSPVGGWSQVFAIDPTGLDFTEGIVTYNATGPELYKCKDYNFEAQNCYGKWILLADGLTPGQEYNFTLTAEDPIFANTVSTCTAVDSGTQHTFADPCDQADGSLVETDDSLVETHTYTKAGYGGVQVFSVDTGVTNCGSITKVELCYEWWGSRAMDVCDVSVDADGGVSKTVVTTTCPGITANPGVTCTDVTALETFVCTNFFGASGTRAEGNLEGNREPSGKGTTETLSIDVLFFNVTYTASDAVFPLVSWVTPTNNSNYSRSSFNQTFNASVFEANPDTVVFSFDNASGTAFNITATNGSGHWAAYYNVSSLAEGTHLVTIFANDTVGNMNNTEQRSFITDYTAPRTNWVTPVNNSNYSRTSYNQTFNVSILEENFVYGVRFSFDNGTGTAFNVTAINGSGHWAIDYNVSSLAEGYYGWNCLGEDFSGNRAFAIANFTLTIDVTAPNVTVILPAADSSFNLTENIEISINVTDRIGVSNVYANLSYPNGSILLITLSNGVNYLNKYNVSFEVPLQVGNYNITFIANDTSNNRNATQTTNFTTTEDFPPTMTVLGCTPASINLGELTKCIATISDNYQLDSVTATVTLPNGTNVSHDASSIASNYFFNFTNSSEAVGEHTVTWFANDTSQNTIFGIDRFNVTDPTAPTITLNTPNNGSNSSSSSITFNFTATDNFYSALNCSVLINGTINQTNSTVRNGSNTLTTISGFTDGDYLWNITCNDDSNNYNRSTSRTFTIDTFGPTFTSLTTFPDAEIDLDPNKNITIFANVTDNTTGISILVVQYKLSTDSTYTNLTNPSYNTQTGIYNVSFNATTAGTYKLRLWANDSAGNSAYSNLVNIDVRLDKNWSRDPSAFTARVGTLNRQIELGNLTINNSGDYALNYTIVSDSNTTTYNQTENFTLAAGEVRQITVYENATDSGIKTSTLNISSNDTTAVPYSLTTTGTVAVAPGQPILITAFTTPTTETLSVTHGDTNIEFIAKIENLGEGNATNVTFFIDIPDDWTLTFGALNNTFSTLNSGGTETLSIEVTIPSSATTGLQNVIANATGLNGSGTDLHNVSGLDLVFADIVEVTVNAVPTVLGAEEVVVETSPGGGSVAPGGAAGAGGGGGALPSQILTSEDVIVIRRGTWETFPISVNNIDEGTELRNMKLELDGFLSQYMSWIPDEIELIQFGESKDFRATIFVPVYFDEADYPITAKITGDVYSTVTERRIKKLTEHRTLILRVVSFDIQDINEKTRLAEQCIAEMENAEFPTSRVKDLFNKARVFVLNEEYLKARDTLEQICDLKDDSFEADKLIKELEEKIVEAKEKGLDVIDTNDDLDLARLAFEREDFSLAIDRAKSAQLTYVYETRGKINILRFIRDNWYYVIAGLILGMMILLCAFKRLRRIIIRQRIRNLNKEEETIYDLIKETQIDYFKSKVISLNQYNHYIGQYEKRVYKIKQIRTKLRNKRAQVLDIRGELKDLTREEKDIHGLIKEAQKSYLMKGKLSRSKFMNEADAYRDRLKEIFHEKEIIKKRLRTQKKRNAIFWFFSNACRLWGLFSRKSKSRTKIVKKKSKKSKKTKRRRKLT